jgi:hypothetical protein
MNNFRPFKKSERSELSSYSMRKPQRMTITVPWQLHQILLKHSDLQGRSLSNLACFWLESHAQMVQPQGDNPA